VEHRPQHDEFRVFVINLDESVDRMAFMKEQLDRLGLKFERIAAVDGRRLTAAEISKAYSPFWSWLLLGRFMTAGELGCAMSHQLAREKIVSENIPWALILEDDALIAGDLPKALDAIRRALRTYGLVQLHYYEHRHQVRDAGPLGFAKYRLKTFQGNHASAAAYAVSLTAARRLDRGRRIALTADKWAWHSALSGVATSGILPHLVEIDEILGGASAIDHIDRASGASPARAGKSRVWCWTAGPLLSVVRNALIAVRTRAAHYPVRQEQS